MIAVIQTAAEHLGLTLEQGGVVAGADACIAALSKVSSPPMPVSTPAQVMGGTRIWPMVEMAEPVPPMGALLAMEVRAVDESVLEADAKLRETEAKIREAEQRARQAEAAMRLQEAEMRATAAEQAGAQAALRSQAEAKARKEAEVRARREAEERPRREAAEARAAAKAIREAERARREAAFASFGIPASSIDAIKAWSTTLTILSILGIVNIFVSIPGLITSGWFGGCNRQMPQSRYALLNGVRKMKESAAGTIFMAVVVGAFCVIFGFLFITGAECDGFQLREDPSYLCYAVVGYATLAYAGLNLLPVIVCAATINQHCNMIEAKLA